MELIQKIKTIELISSKEILVNFTNKIESKSWAILINDKKTAAKLTSFENKKIFVMNKQVKINDDLKIVEIKNKNNFMKIFPSRKYINSLKFAYKKNHLGANLLHDGSVNLKFWAPTSKKVEVLIYDKATPNKLLQIVNMIFSKVDYIWQISLNKENTTISNLDGYYYQLKLNDKQIVLDPYSKSMASFNFWDSKHKIGKGAFVNLNSAKAGLKPKNIFIENINNNENEMIAYEVHIRDFTIQREINEISNIEKGTFKGFKNWKKGIEHLKSLNITHVQFLPLQKYFTVDENNRKFIKNGKGKFTNYNWGYDPHNYFAISGWLSTNANDPYTRIRELRELINELHKNNIGVILDVVYNHIYNESILNNIVSNVYLREKSDITPAGTTALASENLMTRKLIIDSVKFWVNEFGIDGLRFDLMGFIDSKTIKQIRTLFPKLILQGEGWNFTDFKDKTKAPIIGITAFENRAHLKPHQIKNLAYFNNVIRDSIKGNSSVEKIHSLGFVHGNLKLINSLKASITGSLIDFYLKYKDIYSWNNQADFFAINPNEVLNYISIHDDFSLWDKINLSIEGNLEYKMKLLKQSLIILFTSQGKIIIQGGTELGISRPYSGIDAEIKKVCFSKNAIQLKDLETNSINSYQSNSYQSSDITNMFRWNRLDKDFEKGTFFELNLFMQKLINLRRKINLFNFQNKADILNNLKFLENKVKINSFESDKKFNKKSVIMFEITNPKNNLYIQKKWTFSKIFIIHNVNNFKISIENLNENNLIYLLKHHLVTTTKTGLQENVHSKIIVDANSSIIIAKKSSFF